MVSAFVVDGNRARRRLITIGKRAAGKVEILAGLSAGEKVVNPIPSGLCDGCLVEIR